MTVYSQTISPAKGTKAKKENSDFLQKLSEVVSLFQEAEKVLKLCDRITIESNLPAINEWLCVPKLIKG